MMSEGWIKWDAERLNDSIKSIRNAQTDLEVQIDTLEKINNTVAGAWKGAAGTAFDMNMDFDTVMFKLFLGKLNDLMNDLQRVNSEAYCTAEDAVKTEIERLYAKV